MLDFLCLGSGSSGNCYFLNSQGNSMLLDAGLPFRDTKRILSNHGFSLEQVRAILVTHDHADHIKAVPRIANDLNIPVYATPQVHEGINRNYSVKIKLLPERQRPLTKEATTLIAGFQVTPFEVSHDSSDCVGFSIQAGGVNFTLVTDCGHVTPHVSQAIAQAQYLVIEANHEVDMLHNGHYPDFLKERVSGERGHLSNADCARALVTFATPKLRHVWLCHLSEDNNHPELARQTVTHILRASGIVPGADFALDVLKRRTPSPVYRLT